MTVVQGSSYFPIEPGCGGYWCSAYLYRPGPYRTIIEVVFYGDTSGESAHVIHDGTDDDAAFVRRSKGVQGVPSDCYQARFNLTFHSSDPFDPLDPRPAWVTGFMVQPDPDDTDDPAAYADGDTAGWEWDGEAHNSASREA